MAFRWTCPTALQKLSFPLDADEGFFAAHVWRAVGAACHVVAAVRVTRYSRSGLWTLAVVERTVRWPEFVAVSISASALGRGWAKRYLDNLSENLASELIDFGKEQFLT